MRAGGRVVLRATAFHVLAEAGRSPAVPSSFAVPGLPSKEVEARFPGMERFPYGDALEWRFVIGGFGELGPATVWTRSRIPLVQGMRAHRFAARLDHGGCRERNQCGAATRRVDVRANRSARDRSAPAFCGMGGNGLSDHAWHRRHRHDGYDTV